MDLIFIALGVFLVFIVGKLLLLPMKVIMKLVWNGVIGGLTLLLFNLIGGLFGLNIEITGLNAIISGFFGVPGIILILLLS